MTESITFSQFVAGLAASAGATLRYVDALLAGEDPGDDDEEQAEPPSPEERADIVASGLHQARHLIDTLVMLEKKTQGNLTDDETRGLQAMLADLRMAYVNTDGRARKARESDG